MSKDTWRVSADVPHSTRGLLLRMLPPKFARIYALSLTWAYGVPAAFEFDDQMQDCTLYAHHEGAGTEALLARLGTLEFRPDGKPLFLTLSCKEGIEPAQAGDIDMARIRPIKLVTFGTRLIRRPLWKQTPTTNRHVAA